VTQPRRSRGSVVPGSPILAGRRRSRPPTARPEAPRWGEGPEEWILLGDGGDPALADVLRAALEAAAGRAVLRWLHARRPWRAQADHRGLALEVRLRAAPDPGSALRVVEAGGVGAVAAGALAR
jgi:hypothetical protein